MKYSPSTRGFYDSVIHGENVPDDSIDLSDDEYQELIDGQSHGKVITVDANSRLVLQDPPAPTSLQLADQVRRKRNDLLSSSEYFVARHREQTEFGVPTTLDAAQFVNVLAYRQSLRDVPEQPDFPQSVVWPTLF
jgi:hypothetical protein